MDARERQALTEIRTIDLTTYGRRTGNPSRIEIWWFYFEEMFIVTGSPGRRDWMANASSNPQVIVHANGGSYRGRARPIGDTEVRRRFFRSDVTEIQWYATQAELDTLVHESPMIEIAFD